MIIGYEHATRFGVFHILLSAGIWTVFFDEVKLGEYSNTIQAIDSLIVGQTLEGGRNTSSMGVPAELSEWTEFY
jgi:hypothetical protein